MARSEAPRPEPAAEELDRGSLASAAAASIRSLIHLRDLAPGDPIPPVTELATQLSISRTIAREAIELLAQDGTIKEAPHRRWQVGHVPQPSIDAPRVVPEVDHRPLSDQVADAVLDMVLAEGLVPGDPLPSARSLAERFDVSVVVVREAFSALAARGLLSRRQGREALVALPDYRLLGSLMHARAHLEGIAASDFQGAREVLEVEAARLAAFSRNPHKRSLLEPHFRGMVANAGVDEHARIKNDLGFHLALANLSGNPAIELVLNSLHEVIVIHMQLANLEVEVRAGRRGHEMSLAAHERVLNAVVGGDVDGAEAAVREHFSLIDHL